MKKAFTLIELLIVVAIIAILAAIAVPNFLEAQVRSKVSRIKADMRSIATALEAYVVDYNQYPYGNNYNMLAFTYELTTPVSFMTALPWRDPFGGEGKFEDDNPNGNTIGSLFYVYYGAFGDDRTIYSAVIDNQTFTVEKSGWADYSINDDPMQAFMLYSVGPDRKEGVQMIRLPLPESSPNHQPDANAIGAVYDTTNGTTSLGDIGRIGGQIGDPERAGWMSD